MTEQEKNKTLDIMIDLYVRTITEENATHEQAMAHVFNKINKYPEVLTALVQTVLR